MTLQERGKRVDVRRHRKPRLIGVNLGREPFFRMPHGLHGNPGRHVLNRHPRAKGFPHGVQVETFPVLIDEGDSSRIQIPFEGGKFGKHLEHLLASMELHWAVVGEL